jgi:hypothetical protein
MGPGTWRGWGLQQQQQIRGRCGVRQGVGRGVMGEALQMLEGGTRLMVQGYPGTPCS